MNQGQVFIKSLFEQRGWKTYFQRCSPERKIRVDHRPIHLLGGLIGTALGLAVTWYHATAGFDLAMFTDQGGFTVMGVAFTGKIYAILTPVAALQPILVMVMVAFLAGLWPALKSAKLDPAPTIAGRQ